MLTLALAILAATGDCKPGVDCVSQSFRPGACVTAANLGTCTAAMAGKSRCVSNDGNAWYFCNGTGWGKFSSSSDGGGDFVLKSGDTMTGPLVNAADVNLDGGRICFTADCNYRAQKAAGLVVINADGGSAEFRVADYGIEFQASPARLFSSVSGGPATLEWNSNTAGGRGAGAVDVVNHPAAPTLFSAQLDVQAFSYPVPAGYAILGVTASDAGYSVSLSDDRKVWADNFCPWDGGTCWTGQVQVGSVRVVSCDAKDFGATAAGSCDDISCTVPAPAVVDGTTCSIGATAASWTAATGFFCFVSDTSTIKLRRCCYNLTTACTDIASANYKATVIVP